MIKTELRDPDAEDDDDSMDSMDEDELESLLNECHKASQVNGVDQEPGMVTTTQSFSFGPLERKKSSTCPGIIKSLLSSFVPPSDSLVSVPDLSRTLNPCLIRCFPDFGDTRTPSGVSRKVQRSQRTPSNTADLDCAFVKNAIFFTLIHDFEKPTANYLELSK